MSCQSNKSRDVDLEARTSKTIDPGYDGATEKKNIDGKAQVSVGATAADYDIGQTEEIDLYEPFPVDPDAIQEDRILTIRSIIVGCALGTLVNASNAYLGNLHLYRLVC